MKWTTQDQSTLEIGDMNDGHLINAIHLLRAMTDKLQHNLYHHQPWSACSSDTREWIEDKSVFELSPFNELQIPTHNPHGDKVRVRDEEISLRFFVLCMEAKKRGLNYVKNDKQRFDDIDRNADIS